MPRHVEGLIALILVIILQSLDSSKLPHPHQHYPDPHSHLQHLLPHVTVGPYRPWTWDDKSLTGLDLPTHTGAAASKGYETNIIIDQVTFIKLVLVCSHEG